jgi:hypothetical protein
MSIIVPSDSRLVGLKVNLLIREVNPLAGTRAGGRPTLDQQHAE